MNAKIDADILSQLIALEPIFHRFEHLRERSPRRADFVSMMAAGFFEIGASGRLYSRDFILEVLEERFTASAPPPDVWQTSEFRLLQISSDTWLLTYLLQQEIDGAPRISRRTTLWKKVEGRWQILFHQGTLVEDVQLPANTKNSK